MKNTYAHPLEDIFDIESDSTLSPVQAINNSLYDDDTVDCRGDNTYGQINVPV